MESPIVQALRRVPLFAGLSEPELYALAPSIRKRRYRANEVLFNEGDEGHTLYVILSGSVKIQTTAPTGETVHLALRTAGEPIGEMALLDGKPRMAAAVTAEPSEILLLDRREFRQRIQESPDIAFGVMAVLADRLREAAGQMESQQGLNVTGRLSELLLELSETHGSAQGGDIRIGIKLSQRDLAERLGAARETVNRAFAGLRAVGAIRMDGRTVIITSERKLRQYCSR